MRTLMLMAIFATSVASAQTTYDYTGQAMLLTGEISTDAPPPYGSQTYTMQYAVLGDVVLSQALFPNQVNQQVVPLAYSFNDPGLGPGGGTGLLTYSASVPYGSPLTPVGTNPVPWPGAGTPATTGIGIPTLTFSTSHGDITSFSMTFGGSYPYGGETLTLTKAGDSFYGSSATPDCECEGSWSGSNSVGGKWTRAPEINPSVAGTALTLLVGGLLVARGRRPAFP
jgi:hypothetical protein